MRKTRMESDAVSRQRNVSLMEMQVRSLRAFRHPAIPACEQNSPVFVYFWHWFRERLLQVVAEECIRAIAIEHGGRCNDCGGFEF